LVLWEQAEIRLDSSTRRGVEFRIAEKSSYRFLTLEFDPLHVLSVAELQHLSGFEAMETWNYDHPLTWALADAISNECESDARQGLLFVETAITLLALHVVRRLSNVASPVRMLRRGGLAPAVLHRACEYLTSRLAENVSLSEVAAVANLSLGHFAFASRNSTGISPHAWLRRQRVDRAKALLLDGDLGLDAVTRLVGFAHPSAFGAAFKKETGWTPAAWRRVRCS
jgi:AraC family transcriptional regulator